MGKYDIKVDGVKIVVHVVDSVAAMDKHIAKLRSRLECNTKVVGLDYVEVNFGRKLLVLYALGHGLVIQLDYLGTRYNSAPESLEKFLGDPNICFVGAKFDSNNIGVKLGELAARVLKKPALTESSLADIAKEVGVSYDGPPTGTATVLEIDSSNPNIFTEEHVSAAISDAIVCYQIGYKLLKGCVH